MSTKENKLGAKVSWLVVMLVIGGCAYTLVQDQKLQTRRAERHRLLIFGGQLALHIKAGTAITNWNQFAKVIDWTTVRGIETKYSLRPLEMEYVIVYPIPDSLTTDYGAIVLIKKKTTRQSHSTTGRYALIRHLDNTFGVTWLNESEMPATSVESWSISCPSGLLDQHPFREEP